jgi:DNA (cytosine-5)-methyltransferase 1
MTKILFIDLFAGAGGVTTGVSKDPRVKVIVCINHDKNAIKSHAANHPECIHLTEDIRHVNLQKLKDIVEQFKAQYPKALLWLHGSLECTNFSDAKGGGPKNADSRSLGEHMPDYITVLNPDFFSIENVREFMRWGPLDKSNKPIKSLEGTTFREWTINISTLNGGYYFDHKILNAADYGGYTKRKRLFMLFSRNKTNIVWPEITHFKDISYKPVKDLLDFSDFGNCVFERKKPLVEASLARIYNGLRTYDKPYLVTYYSNGKNHHSIDDPSPTVTTKDRISVVVPFMLRDFTKGYLGSIEEPCGTLLTVPKVNVVTAHLLNPQWGNSTGKSVEEPCFTLIARMDKAPPLLVLTVDGKSPEISPKDSFYAKRIKELMKEKGIGKVTIRSLTIPELLQIQGFPEDYKLVGTQTEQKRYIGNSVETTVMHRWIESVVNTLN